MKKTLVLIVVCQAMTAFDALAQNHGGGAPMGPMYHYARWSPDGKSVSVVLMSGSTSRLLVYPAEGGEPRTVPLADVGLMAADWTPQGALTFLGTKAGATAKYVVSAKGGD